MMQLVIHLKVLSSSRPHAHILDFAHVEWHDKD